jgi:uncharacterized protein
MSCGIASPIVLIGLALPKVVLPMCSSFGLKTCLEQLSQTQWARTPDYSRCQAIFSILPGGSLLSSPEDRENDMPDHAHAAIARRLKRANGHLETIIEMIEQDRPCSEIAQQLQAVESAIDNAKKTLIHDHITHGLERSLKTSGAKGQAALRDFKLIAKYL